MKSLIPTIKLETRSFGNFKDVLVAHPGQVFSIDLRISFCMDVRYVVMNKGTITLSKVHLLKSFCFISQKWKIIFGKSDIIILRAILVVDVFKFQP